MRFITKGLVLKQQKVGEKNRLITVLTENRGVIRAFAYGAESIKNAKNAATTMFSYSTFTISESKSSFIIEDSVVIETFFGLRNNISKLALAQYVLELGYVFSPENNYSGEFLRIILNTLWFLSKGKKNESLLKSVIELRLISMSGYAPSIVACEICGNFESGKMYFSISSGLLYCENHQTETAHIELQLPVVRAMRHIIFSNTDNLWNFEIGNEFIDDLNFITEKYLLLKSEHAFLTLDFYNMVKE